MTDRAPAPAPAGPVRYLGVDLARFLAIIGMVAAHLIGIAAWGPESTTLDRFAQDLEEATAAGNAAVLFAVLGGLSTVFATRRLLADGRVGGAIAATAIRGALILGLGLLLSLLVSPIVVVLAYYGAAMLLVSALVAAPTWLLAALAALLTVAGGPINAMIRESMAVVSEGRMLPYEPFFGEPWAVPRILFLTGYYPAITWAAYLLIGIIAARILTGAAARGRLGRAAGGIAVVGGIVSAAAHTVSWLAIENLGLLLPDVPPDLIGQARLGLEQDAHGAPIVARLPAYLLSSPHSGSPIEMLSAAGLALAVIGVLVLLVDARRATGDPLGPLLGAARAAGAAPLTIYTAHVVVTTLLLGPAATSWELLMVEQLPWWVGGPWAWVLQVAAILAVGAVLRRLGRRGPLEALLSGAVRVVVR